MISHFCKPNLADTILSIAEYDSLFFFFAFQNVWSMLENPTLLVLQLKYKIKCLDESFTIPPYTMCKINRVLQMNWVSCLIHILYANLH